MPNLRFTPATRESMAINEASGPAIVIAGSGMCTAGRIKHHLKHNLWRPGASIVIVGFQAKGVKIFRENVAVRARVFTIGGFSAHADQEDLLEWVSHFESSPRVFVVHGEAAASTALAEKIRERLHLIAHIPTWRERLILKPKDLATEKPAAEEEAPDVKALMLNTIIDLENELKTLRKKVQSAEVDRDIGEDEIDRLRYIQDDLKSVFGS